jgi:alkylated DNA repair protein alkB family protein 1
MKQHIKRESVAYDGETPLAQTIFRQEEKKFKHSKYDQTEVIDFANFANMQQEYKNSLKEFVLPDNKKVFAFDKVPGLFILPQYFSLEEQKYWLHDALYEYPKSSIYANNLVALDKTIETTSYTKNLRWCRLGESYDWNTSSYQENRKMMGPNFTDVSEILDPSFCDPVINQNPTNKPKSNFPSNLEECIKKIVVRVESVDSNNDIQKVKYNGYNPEVAFVNYYPVGSYMMAHQDKSELTYDRPLVSISLGCSCIFLIGTDNRNDKPYAFCFHSGDAICMTAESRLAFHGVPKIFDDCPEELLENDNIMKGLRVNINVRQVFD